MRVRENAGSIAFYGGESKENETLVKLLGTAVENQLDILVTSRNLGFFTSYYRYLISLLPAAVIAPLYFKGDIEFGVINQSSSAFSHILGDVSLVVYEIGALAGFSAIIDRLGEFTEVLDASNDTSANYGTRGGEAGSPAEAAEAEEVCTPERICTTALEAGTSAGGATLLATHDLTLVTPDASRLLIKGLTLEVKTGEPLLVMGPSGTGKTSFLRAVAGLWNEGEGEIARVGGGSPNPAAEGAPAPGPGLLFLPQKPYMVLGSLRKQLLYPTWTEGDGAAGGEAAAPPLAAKPSDAELLAMLAEVGLGQLVERLAGTGRGPGLDTELEWSSILSLGEQQRLAFARLLLAKPRLAVLDESTSALDIDSEELLYRRLLAAGITCVSVGHRPSLAAFHTKTLNLREGGAWEVVESAVPAV